MALGDITLIDTRTILDEVFGPITAVHISGDVVACAYSRLAGGYPVKIRTFNVDSAGNISSDIDSKTIFYPSGLQNAYHVGNLVKIASGVYALTVHFKYSLDIRGLGIATINIDDDGNIAVDWIDTLNVKLGGGYAIAWAWVANDLQRIEGSNYYAIPYLFQYYTDDWYEFAMVATVSIEPDGSIAGAVTDELNLGALLPAEDSPSNLCHVSSDVYALAWANKVSTINISSSDGSISLITTNTEVWEGANPKIANAGGGFFAISYSTGEFTGGYIVSFTISDDGLSISAPITNIRWCLTRGICSCMLKLFESGGYAYLVITAVDYSWDGQVRTFSCSLDDGSLALVSPLTEFYTGGIHLFETYIILVHSSTEEVFLIAGQLEDYNGLLRSLSIYSPAAVTLATATTNAATAVGSGVGTPNGTLDDDGGEACDCGFEWGETDAYGETTPPQSREIGQTFSYELSGLDPDTTYHFRAFATNSAGTGYGSDANFTTNPVSPSIVTPTVTTDEPTVAEEVANIIGTLVNNGGEDCDCHLEWGRTTAYGNLIEIGTKTTGETFSQQISGLTPNTEYHYRAYAKNSVGTGYGVDRKFTTKQRPVVNFRPVENRSYVLSRWEL